MAGQIISMGERTWLVRVYVGRDPESGNTMVTPFTARKRTLKRTSMES
jgi:hypothetical protein